MMPARPAKCTASRRSAGRHCVRSAAARLVLVFCCLLAAVPAAAQNMLDAHPLDLASGQAHLFNPALPSHQRSMVQAGIRFFHLGFIEGDAARLRLNYVSAVLPRWLPGELAFAAHAQSLSLPLYRQNYVSLSLSRRVSRMLAVGVKAGLMSRYYDAGEFELVDANDPVFADRKGKTNLDLGAGVTFWPLPFVSLAFSRDHLNRPNLAMADPELRLAPENHLALGLHTGSSQVGLYSTAEAGTWQAGGFAEYARPDLGFVRLGLLRRALQFEGRARVYGPVACNYLFNYPTNELRGQTSGSHEFALVVEFDRLSRLPKVEEAPQFSYPFRVPVGYFSSSARAYARAEQDELTITVQQLLRTIAPDVPLQALAALSPFDLGVLDTSRTAAAFPLQVTPIDFADTTAHLRGSYSTFYRRSLQQLSASLVRMPVYDATIIAGPTALHRAQTMRNYLSQPFGPAPSPWRVGLPQFDSVNDSLRYHRRVGRQALRPREESITLSPPAAIFLVTAAHFPTPPQKWELVVENESGRRIWSLSGNGRFPHQLVWDWRDQEGRVVAPGYYRYYLTWVESRGRSSRSPERKFYVRKLQRTTHIQIKRRFDGLDAPADEIKMILHR